MILNCKNKYWGMFGIQKNYEPIWMLYKGTCKYRAYLLLMVKTFSVINMFAQKGNAETLKKRQINNFIKMRKFKVITCVLIFMATPFLSNAGFVCNVSSNPALNTGHCREYSEGHDLCFPDGEGPACKGSEDEPPENGNQ
ncbi:MAG: hypothetical protein ACI8Q1_003593 [Parvicella sp.]|jgi:hypothetical protein